MDVREVRTVEHTSEHEELLAAAALDSLEGDDLAAFETNLERCFACRTELEEYQETAGNLGLLIPPQEPTPELKTRLFEAVYEDSRIGGKPIREDVADLATLQSLTQRRPARKLMLAGAMAALLFVVGGGWMASEAWQMYTDRSQVEALGDIATDPDSRKVVLSDPSTGHAQATAIMKGGEVVLTSEALAPTAPEQMYVLWMQNPAGDMVAVAGFDVTAGEKDPVLEAQMSGPVKALALSLEPKGNLPATATHSIAHGEV